MKDSEIERIEKAVALAIEENVNGKISAIHKMLETQNKRFDTFERKVDNRFDPESNTYILKNVQPIIEAYRGSKVLGEMLKWLAIVGAAFLFLKSNFHL